MARMACSATDGKRLTDFCGYSDCLTEEKRPTNECVYEGPFGYLTWPRKAGLEPTKCSFCVCAMEVDDDRRGRGGGVTGSGRQEVSTDVSGDGGALK
jgi:hypothetical protein